MSETTTVYPLSNRGFTRVGGVSFKRYADGSVMIIPDVAMIRQEDVAAVALALLGPPSEAMIEQEAVRAHHRLRKPRWEGDEQPPFIADSDHADVCRRFARGEINRALKLIERVFGQDDGAQ